MPDNAKNVAKLHFAQSVNGKNVAKLHFAQSVNAKNMKLRFTQI
jgi:hypothetical protein